MKFLYLYALLILAFASTASADDLPCKIDGNDVTRVGAHALCFAQCRVKSCLIGKCKRDRCECGMCRNGGIFSLPGLIPSFG
ncbi:unnamed protein product [Caenorhabditis auriculariae]|uniref:Uncharacterized protein n=1 Tax=Caenorhabditis auriculariae TaxID=2777116 RepID=A0A8S1H5Y5_9PELO|nr:unnamed protein product [Caenorhabditis auriculariae]